MLNGMQRKKFNVLRNNKKKTQLLNTSHLLFCTYGRLEFPQQVRTPVRRYRVQYTLPPLSPRARLGQIYF